MNHIHTFETKLADLNEKLRERTEALTQYSHDLETARACIQQLQKQVEELQKDKERLDWLNSQLAAFFHTINGKKLIAAGPLCDTVREAIDAARKEAE